MSQLDRFLGLLASPLGIAGGLLLLVLSGVLVSVRFRWALWGVMALLIFTSSLSSPSKEIFALAPPLKQLSREGRSLTVVCLLFLLVPALSAKRGSRRRIVFGPMLLYLLFQLLFSFMYFLAGDTERGIFAPIIFLLTFFVFGIGLSRMLQRADDLDNLLKMLIVVALAVVLGTVYQLSVDRAMIMAQGRLFGLTGNPQALAIYCGALVLPVVAGVQRLGHQRIWYLLALFLTGFLVVFLLWSGSRTGILMTLTGLGLMFRHQLGGLLKTTILVATMVMFAWQVTDFGESSAVIQERFGRSVLVNTREATWNSMLTVFVENPIFGSTKDVWATESSYLGALARFGVVGTAPLFISVTLVLMALVKLNKKRSGLGEHAILVDLVTAGFFSLAIGAVFEGFLMATLTPMLYMIYIYMALGAFLLDRSENVQGGQYVGKLVLRKIEHEPQSSCAMYQEF